MHALRLAVLGLVLSACQDQPAQSTGPTPPPVQQGVAAFITVDNLNAAVGQTVRVRVEVQVGSQQNYKLGSFTGRLRFNAAKLQFKAENPINDGMRVANTTTAATGLIRFAGASPKFSATWAWTSGVIIQAIHLSMQFGCGACADIIQVSAHPVMPSLGTTAATFTPSPWSVFTW